MINLRCLSHLWNYVMTAIGNEYRFWYWKVQCCFKKIPKRWQWLWNWVMGRGERVMRCLNKKVQIALKRLLVETQTLKVTEQYRNPGSSILQEQWRTDCMRLRRKWKVSKPNCFTCYSEEEKNESDSISLTTSIPNLRTTLRKSKCHHYFLGAIAASITLESINFY